MPWPASLSRVGLRLAFLVPGLLLPWAVAADDPVPGLPPGTVVLRGHTEPVYAIAFTPDGRNVVTASFDKSLKVWQADSGREVRTFGGPGGHQGLVLAVAVSSDGQSFVSGGADNTARVWDFPSSSPAREFPHGEAVRATALSPDGKLLAGGGKDGVLKVWNTADGKAVGELKGHTGPVQSVSWSGNGQLLVSGGADETTRFWDVAKGQMLVAVGGSPGAVRTVLVNPNTATAYSAGEDGVVRQWRLPAEAARTLPPHAGAVTALSLSADGGQVLTGSADGAVRLSSFANGQPVRQWKGPAEAVTAVGLAPPGTLTAAGTQGGRLYLWNAQAESPLADLEAHPGGLSGLAFLAGGAQMLTSGKDGLLRVWPLPPQAERLLTHPGAVLALALAPDGKRLFTGGADKVVRLWNPANPGQAEREFAGHTAAVTAVAVASGGQVLASAGADGTIRLWNQASGQTADVLGGHAGAVTGLGVSASGQEVVSSSADGIVKVWQLGRPAPRPLAHADQVLAAVASPDGSKLLTACADRSVRLWNLANATVERNLATPAAGVTALAYAAQGGAVGAAGADRSVTVWNAGTGAEVKKFANLPAAPSALALSPDGKLAAAGFPDGSVRLLEVASGKELRRFDGGGPVTGLTYSPAGDLVLAAAGKGVHAWQVADGAARPVLAHDANLTGLALSKDGALVAAAGADRAVRVWKVTGGQAVARFTAAADVRGLAFSPDATRLVVGGADGRAVVHDLDGRMREFLGHAGPVAAVAFVSDGKQVASAGGDKTVQVWQPALRWQAAQGSPARCLLVSPRGDQVIAGGEDGAVKSWNLTDGKPGLTLAAHEGPVVGLAATPDGTKLVSAGADRAVKTWALARGAAASGDKPMATITLPGAAQSLALSPSGQKLAVGVGAGKQAAIKVFDLATGRELQGLPGHAAAVSALAFQSDNRTLLSGGSDRAVRVSDVAVLSAFEAHPGGVTSLALLGGGGQAITGGADGTVKAWEPGSGKLVRSYGPLLGPVSAVAASRDGIQVAAAAGPVLKVWNAADGKEVRTLEHPGAVTSVAFDNDRSRVVTGCADGQARVWQAATGKVLQTVRPGGAVHVVAFHPNNQHVLAAGADKSTLIAPVLGTGVLASPAPVRALALAPSGQLATGGDGPGVALCNPSSGMQERTVEAVGPVEALAVARNGVLLAVGGKDGIIRLATLADGKAVGQMKTSAPLCGLAFTPNSQVLVSASTDGGLRAWNVAFNPGQPAPADFGQPVQAYAAGPARDVAFAADGTTFYTSGEDGKARAWRLASPASTRSFNHPREVDCVGLNPAGTVLATGSHDGNVRLWDVAKGTAIKDIKAHPPAAPAAGQNPTNPVYCLAWLPGANQVISGGKDGSLKLWDAAAGTLVREFRAYKQKESDKGHKDAVFCAAVSPDGKVLASGSGGQERVVKLWNVSEGTVLRDFVNPHLKPNPGGGTPSHPGWVYGVRFTPDGKYLVSVGAAPRGQGYLAVWSVADGKLVRALELPVGTLYSVAVSPDGGRIAVAAGLSGGKLQDVNRSYIFPVPGPDK